VYLGTSDTDWQDLFCTLAKNDGDVVSVPYLQRRQPGSLGGMEYASVHVTFPVAVTAQDTLPAQVSLRCDFWSSNSSWGWLEGSPTITAIKVGTITQQFQ
jgi:hypothetical protein